MAGPGRRSLAATFVTLGVSYGVWYSYSVFLVALLQEFGWSRTLLSGVFSIFIIVHGVVGVPLGWLADRLGPRRLMLAGGVILGVGLLADGAVTDPWHLYAAFGGLTALGVSAAGWVPAVILVQRWFPERVGIAIGITSAGIGAGIFVAVPLCQWLIETVGWRVAYRTLALIAAGWIVPANLWLVHDPPAARRPAGNAPTAGSGSTREDPTLADALRSLPFWLCAAAMSGSTFLTQLLLAHQVAYLVDHGIPALVAASVVGVVGATSIVGKAAGGWASDVFGRERTYTFGITCQVASLGALGLVAVAPGPLWPYVYGVLAGLGYSVTAPLMPAVISDLFRGRHFGAIFGMLHVANATGGALGPWVGGRVFDVTGSYRAAFLGAIGVAVAATAALWVAAPRRRRGARA